MLVLKRPDLIACAIFSDTYQEKILSVLPFFHIYGFNGILNGVLAHGLHMVTIPKFTPESYIECVLKFKVRNLTHGFTSKLRNNLNI